MPLNMVLENKSAVGQHGVVSDFNENYYELAVQNTGQLNGLQNGEGFGLSSTTDRLNLLYGDKAKFEYETDYHITC